MNSWEMFHIFCQKYNLRDVSLAFEKLNQNFTVEKWSYEATKFGFL